MEHLIAEFLAERVDTCAANSRATYGAYLRHYATWAASAAGEPWAPATIRAYIASRSADSNATLRSRVRYLRQFCDWLEDRADLEHNPFRGRGRVLMPAKKRARRQVYTQIEVVGLLQATAPVQWKAGLRKSSRRQWTPDGPLEREDLQGRALVLLCVDSALRAGEITALNCGQVRAPRLLIKSKGGHLDIAFITPATRAVLLELAGERENDTPLFRDWNNRRCTVRGLRGILQRLARRAGIDLPPRPLHAFRHYAARQWVKAKVPDLAIRQLMRHESLSTTQIYTELEPDELAALHAEASPIVGLLVRAGMQAA